jgi:hypothetical protein
MDITAHNGNPIRLARVVRNWLANVSRRQLVTDLQVANLFEKFSIELPNLAELKGYEVTEIPYVDFEYLVTGWLLA